MNSNDVLDEFRKVGALLEGHFILSSGRRSPVFLQKALVFSHPQTTERLCGALARKLEAAFGKIDVVVGPAVGGLIPGYETARQLGCRSVYTEREGGVMSLRRGFSISADERVIIVEDIVTTGVSMRETLAALKEAGAANVIGAACIVDRANGRADTGGLKLVSLAGAEMSLARARLGVNIDHIATIRNARGGMHPEPAKAAALAEAAGADGITIHLREDRRHIRDGDLAAVRKATKLPINLEMAATEEMLAIALGFGPHAACIVPERREERTTEGGIDAARLYDQIAPMAAKLREKSVRVSLFIEPSLQQIAAAERMGAPVVELHTGKYVELVFAGDKAGADGELKRLQEAAALGADKGIEIHVGHGLTYDTVRPVAAIPQVKELNIGHFIMGEALFVGLDAAVKRMRAEIDAARGSA